MLPEMEETGQERLKSASVLIVGMGGLGSSASLYLAAAGVGNLVIADHDDIDLSNLQRQILYRQSDLQTSKVAAAKQQLAGINSHIRIRSVERKLLDEELQLEVSLADVVLDCTDNLMSRYAINQACVIHNKVLISAAAIGWKGQLMAFDFSGVSKGCYDCLFPQQMGHEEPKGCSTSGVIGPVVGLMGNLQALETIKHLAGIEQANFGYFQQFDGINNQWIKLQIKQDSSCHVCSPTICIQE
jgi:sulfur carrier protein ThiS adenylyltransferase